MLIKFKNMGLNRWLLRTVFVIFYVAITSKAQIVPFYPIEIIFSPCGYTNALPGAPVNEYTTFSSLKILMEKDLPSTERLSNTISFVGNIIRYHNITKARGFFPFSLNPTLRTHFFANDIFTLGLELNGNVESMSGLNIYTLDSSNTKKEVREIFKYSNYRIRVRPFHYLIINPNLIFRQIYTYGISYNTDKSSVSVGAGEYEKLSRDYTILKWDAVFILLTKFHTRFFLAPFCSGVQWKEIKAMSANGKPNKTNPPLNEIAYGASLGFRYTTFEWGYTEGVFEIEKNIDTYEKANSYIKYKINTKWENQYFTERFGYMFIFDLIKHDFTSPNREFNFGSVDTSEELGQMEIRFDVMPIVNLNRNVSVRPEFDMIYKRLPNDVLFKKFRYWLHLHIYF